MLTSFLHNLFDRCSILGVFWRSKEIHRTDTIVLKGCDKVRFIVIKL